MPRPYGGFGSCDDLLGCVGGAFLEGFPNLFAFGFAFDQSHRTNHSDNQQQRHRFKWQQELGEQRFTYRTRCTTLQGFGCRLEGFGGFEQKGSVGKRPCEDNPTSNGYRCKPRQWVFVLVWILALPPPARWFEKLAAASFVATACLAPIAVSLTPMSEAWCGLLITLALGLTLWRHAVWWLPVLVIAAALALRELALPFLLLAAAFALWERRWKELAAWTVVLVLFAAGLVWHALNVAAVQLPTDLHSPGWAGGLGLRAVLLALANTTILHELPMQLALVVALLPALGWLALEGREGRFAALLLFGYALMIALFSRSDNFYWGFLMVPAWFAGLALVPRAAIQLTRAITRPRQSLRAR